MKQCVFDAGRWRINQQSSTELDEEARGDYYDERSWGLIDACCGMTMGNC